MEQEKPSFAGEIAQNLKQGAQIAQSVVAEVFPDFPLRLFPQGKGFLQLGLPFWRSVPPPLRHRQDARQTATNPARSNSPIFRVAVV